MIVMAVMMVVDVVVVVVIVDIIVVVRVMAVVMVVMVAMLVLVSVCLGRATGPGGSLRGGGIPQLLCEQGRGAGQAFGIKEVHDDIWLVSFREYDFGILRSGESGARTARKSVTYVSGTDTLSIGAGDGI